MSVWSRGRRRLFSLDEIDRFPGKEAWKNLTVVAVVLILATLTTSILVRLSYNASSAGVVYVLAILLVARYTEGYLWGVLTSLISMLLVNYVFTYPFMSLNFTIEGYLLTFAGMLAASAITSALVTRLKKQSRELRRRDKVLMTAEKETMRANLLRAVSHDLRTPLTGIIGMTCTYLENGEQMSEEEKTVLVSGIKDDANWLLNMVENLLSVTRIREGDVKVNTTPELLEEVVSEAVSRLRKRLPEMNVHVKVPDEVLLVPMDAVLIEQVLMNLLENAVYHSGATDAIELKVERDGETILFHIRDFGVGIAPDRLDSLFDGAGSLKPNSSTDAHKGMGIGLTICKTIVEAHRGKIWVRNCDRGAEFVFSLPYGEETQHEQADASDH
ncbi:MAG: DUF4118 domain-containing protein [Clostridiales bacterium]|nr:DUF4118 domain-containing protein [Clostridiales bacterium]